VLAQFTGEDQSGGSLDLSGRDGGSLVVSSQLGGFGSKSLKDILNEGVEDSHGLVGDTSVGVDLLQYSVDVGRVGLLADLGSLLLVTRLGSRLAGLLGSLGGFGRGLTTGGSRGLGGSGSWFGSHLRRKKTTMMSKGCNVLDNRRYVIILTMIEVYKKVVWVEDTW
jgi:hypothetical protein